MNDIRRRIHPRQFIFDIADNEVTPFTNKDLEWIAEELEHLLQKKFDVKVENIEVVDVK